MATTRAKPGKSTKSTRKTKEPAAVRADGRPKSLLTLAGERASLEAKRALLLQTLDACGWYLTGTAAALKMGGATQVLKSIRDLGLDEEYQRARARGDVKPGPRAAECE